MIDWDDVWQMPEGAEAEDGSSEEEGSEEEASESEEEEKKTPKLDANKAVSADPCFSCTSACSCSGVEPMLNIFIFVM